MITRRKKMFLWITIGVLLLLIANGLVALQQMGTQPGRTYRWVCRDSGAELSYTHGVFGSGRLVPGNPRQNAMRWELVEPRPPSPLLPWNWLAAIVDQSAPDPEVVISQESLRAN